MKITACMVPGHGRDKSEDRLLVCETILSKGCYQVTYTDRPQGCLAVFDGVGGIAGGAEAASYAAEQMRWYGGSAEAEALREFLYQVGLNLHHSQHNATTATGLMMEQGRVLLFHVGNTRMYALLGEFLERVTDDQTTIAEVFAGEIITDALRNAYGHEITGCLGGMKRELSSRVTVRDITGQFSSMKKILFTCDGIHDYVPVDRLEKMAKGEYSMEDIIRMARHAGSEDDCSLLLVEPGETLPE